MQEKKFGLLLLAFIIGIAAGCVGGFCVGIRRGAAEVRVDAVRAGHARHIIVDEHGRTTFEWIPVQVPASDKR